MLLYDVFYTDDDGNQTLSGTWNDVDLARQFCAENFGVDPELASIGEDIVASWESPDGEGTITIVERTVDG
jgi:hypothetical protein